MSRPDPQSQATAGPVAIVEACGALVLAQVLADCLVDGLKLQTLLLKSGLTPAEVEAGMAAAAALRDAGATRLERMASISASGNAETRFPRDRASSVSMTTKDVSRVLGLGERQIRNLAAAGDLPSARVGAAYSFDRADVLAFRDARWSS
jgi:excisionase family DNA binding protein